MTLIDRDELIEQMWRSDVSSREKIEKIIMGQPVVATARTEMVIELKPEYYGIRDYLEFQK